MWIKFYSLRVGVYRQGVDFVGVSRHTNCKSAKPIMYHEVANRCDVFVRLSLYVRRDTGDAE
jgi:hypothetical protein